MKGYILDLKLKFACFKASLKGTVTFLNGPPMPGPITITLVSEDGTMLVYDVTLPAAGAADVVSRELTVTLGDGDATLIALPADCVLYPGLRVEQDTPVSLSLEDVDDAGNHSPARVLTFTAADTLAPPQPGEMGVTLVAEE